MGDDQGGQNQQRSDSREHQHAPSTRSQWLRTRILRDKNASGYSKGDVIIGQGIKIGRNEPCPCGSGAKFKRCCIA